MSAAAPVVTSRDRSVEEDVSVLQALEQVGIVLGDVTYRSGGTVYRLIGILSAEFIDFAGKRQCKMRWPFEVWCDVRYPKSCPTVRLPRDADVPPNGSFKRGLLSRLHLNGSFLFPGSPVTWLPSRDLKRKIHRPMDCVLAFLASINEDELRQRLTEARATFSREWILSHDVLRGILGEGEHGEDSSDLSPNADIVNDGGSAHANINADPLAPFPRLTSTMPCDIPARGKAAANRAKKFVIRETSDTNEIVTLERPTNFQLIRTAMSADRDGCSVFVRMGAMRTIIDHIEWEKRTPRNVYEQGGILVGIRCATTPNADEFVVISAAIPAQAHTKSTTYLKLDHGSWHELLSGLDQMKEQDCVERESVIIGWYHTHPNGLDIFMSGTDLATQRSLFFRPWNYALVLNPQRRLIGCFGGADACPCNVGLLK